jgi:uncharacterized protein YjiS (DUF1127 family)
MESVMTNVVVPFSEAAMRCRQFAAAAGCLFHQALVAYQTRRALGELPDDLLRDIGLNRSEIAFVANALACGERDPSRDAIAPLNRSLTAPGSERAASFMKIVPQQAEVTAGAGSV